MLVNVAYDSQLVDYPERQRAQGDPNFMLQQASLKGVCSGKARFLVLLSHAAGGDIGLQCFYVGGWLKNPGVSAPFDSNHAWNSFQLDGLRMDADITGFTDNRQMVLARNSRGKIGQVDVLPLRPSVVERFYAKHFGVVKNIGKENSPEPVSISDLKDTATGWVLSDWFKVDTKYVEQLDRFLPFFP